jgi:CheY-like chemotaxis protein
MSGAVKKRATPAGGTRTSSESGIVPRTRQRSVLLVDPDRAARTPLAHLLSDRYAVYEAEDGLMALRLASMIPNLSVVLSEVRLPTLDGFDLVKVWKSHDALKHIPFVFLSANTAPNEVFRLKACGATDCLQKGGAPKAIVKLVGKIMRAAPLTASYREEDRFATR